MLHNSLQVNLSRYTQLTLDISMLKNIFLLHTKCKHVTLAISILKNIFSLAYNRIRNTIISSIPNVIR